jgi:hypothetical protein
MGDPTVMSHLRAVALGLLLVAFIFCTAPNTYAATVVTGSDIPTQPFEITPDSDPLTHDVDIGQTRAVAYIKKMVATRTVVRVTLGELALASNCAETSASASSCASTKSMTGAGRGLERFARRATQR